MGKQIGFEFETVWPKNYGGGWQFRREKKNKIYVI